MNVFGNLTGGQIFIIAIFGFMLLLLLESLRREVKERTLPKVVFRLICLIIGMQIIFYGFREIQSGRWTGVIWVLIGPIVVYLGRGRERIEDLMKKRAEKDQRSKVGKPEFCARCAKKMGKDPKVQSDRIMIYISEDDVEEYVCTVCGYVVKKGILMEPAKLHRYLQEQDLEDIEHEPRFRPIS
jgi:hypothetical protein